MVSETIKTALRQAITEMGISPLPEDINIERPANREHGDWSSNLALAIAKQAGKGARELADDITDYINANLPDGVEEVTTAGPGFINFAVSPRWLYQTLHDVIAKGTDEYGRSQNKTGTKVNIEFVSANPTGPLHAGHARGACYGDAIGNILTAVGYDVHREFYMNDRGLQMQIYGESLQARKNSTSLPDEGYAGEYIAEWAAVMPDGLSLQETIEWGCNHARQDQQETLEQLGIYFDTWFSEKSMIENGEIDKVLGDLSSEKAAYQKDGATWLAATRFSDDKDRVLVKSDGELTYLTPDIAYHRNKYSRADWLINVWGADHHGYIARMKAAMSALGEDPSALTVQITQLVKLVRSGEEVKLSKRQGDIIELRSIINEIGADATRFMYLLQSVDSKQTFDLEIAASRAMENPVYYVQMAHARLCSIQRNAAESGFTQKNLTLLDLEILSHDRETEILRQLQLLPEIIALAARELAPHKLVTWTRDFANAVHGFYHDCYVIGEGVQGKLTEARLNLVVASRIGLKVGLDLLGVTAPEKM